ncbi:class I SAM-dependent methyltransferase [Pelagicoccus sp. SDUM812003]|nr:class I SAM-dependent methyltransferase [Pelagicoccus sp. SDUM812003]
MPQGEKVEHAAALVKGTYQYSGLEAKWYDLLDELSDFEDVDFYRLIVQSHPGPVLDVGCGTGRLMLPLLRDERQVEGIDCSESMLSICERSLRDSGFEARIGQADMRSFDLGERRFGSILIPGYSIQMLGTRDEWIASLRCCRDHLLPGGQVVVPIYLPWDYVWEEADEGGLELRRERRDEATGERLKAFQSWKLDRQAQRLELRNVYRRESGSGRLEEEQETLMRLIWRLPHEMMQLLEEAGFEEVALYGDYGSEPPEEDSETIIYVAKT